MDSLGSKLKPARDERLRKNSDPMSLTLVDAKRKVQPYQTHNYVNFDSSTLGEVHRSKRPTLVKLCIPNISVLYEPTLARPVVTIAQPGRDLSRNIHTLGFIPVCGRFPKRVLSFGGQRTPNSLSLRKWGSFLKGQWCQSFEGRYGNCLSLLELEVQPNTPIALAQNYDPHLRCFTIRDFQLAPTLEEYERIISMPLAKSPPYLFKEQNPS
ncbi:hypothetical protein CR513_21643, partial [Mucuna pruriens]